MTGLIALDALFGALDEEGLTHALRQTLLTPAGLITPAGLAFEGDALFRDPPGMPPTTHTALRAATAATPALAEPNASAPPPESAPVAPLTAPRPTPSRAARWLDITWQAALERQRGRAWPPKPRLALEEAQALHWEVLRTLLTRPLSASEPFEEPTEPLPLASAPALIPGERLAPLHRHGWDLSAALILTARAPSPPAPIEAVRPADLRP
jgi:hypothetical protein